MARSVNLCPSCGVQEGTVHRSSCGLGVDYKSEPVDIGTAISIRIPIEVIPYTNDIRRYVEAMVYKLSVHAAKGRWDGQSIESRIEKLEGEVAELKGAIERGNMVEILLEAADVGNYGLIISAIAMERGK